MYSQCCYKAKLFESLCVIHLDYFIKIPIKYFVIIISFHLLHTV